MYRIARTFPESLIIQFLIRSNVEIYSFCAFDVKKREEK